MEVIAYIAASNSVQQNNNTTNSPGGNIPDNIMRFDVILPNGEPIAHFEARDKNQGERIGSAYIERENLPTGTTLRTISPGGIFTGTYKFNCGSRTVLVKAPQSQRPAIERVKESFHTKLLSYDNLMLRLESIRGAYIEVTES